MSGSENIKRAEGSICKKIFLTEGKSGSKLSNSLFVHIAGNVCDMQG